MGFEAMSNEAIERVKERFRSSRKKPKDEDIRRWAQRMYTKQIESGEGDEAHAMDGEQFEQVWSERWTEAMRKHQMREWFDAQSREHNKRTAKKRRKQRTAKLGKGKRKGRRKGNNRKRKNSRG